MSKKREKERKKREKERKREPAERKGPQRAFWRLSETPMAPKSTKLGPPGRLWGGLGEVLGAFWEDFGGVLGDVFATFKRKNRKWPRSPRLEPARAGSTSARSKIAEKSKNKRPKTSAFQEEASGAHFLWSGVAVGRPKGGPRGCGRHRRDTG